MALSKFLEPVSIERPVRDLSSEQFESCDCGDGGTVAYVLDGRLCLRAPFRGAKGIFGLLLTSLMMPIQVTIIPTFLIMSGLNLIDTHWAIILPLITNAFGVFLMRQFFLTLPRELIEAARIDGANQFTIFWRIALPLAKPALASLAIITFTNTWNNYFLPLVFLNSWEKMTLPLGMFALSNVYGSGNVSIIMAAVGVAVCPVLILFLVAQRQIISGMVGSAVKG
jgi:multiple sugar transport system permease protein